jgi:hypothetical protein
LELISALLELINSLLEPVNDSWKPINGSLASIIHLLGSKMAIEKAAGEKLAAFFIDK